MKRFNLFLTGALAALFGTFSVSVFAQAPLDKYIQQGLENNLALRQKNVSLEKAVLALKVANSYFLPSVNFNGGFTTGDGGRSIALPVGDLLNPVYSTLNQLTESQNFPQIENVDQNFFPKNFVDAHIRTAIPLLNSDLHYNKKVQQDQVLLQEFEVKALERELVKNVQVAYFNYLSAQETVNIYTSALELVQRNLEVNESLLKNGKGLPASVLRAESELENVKAQLSDAKNSLENAARYFNFLLNRPQESSIEATDNLETALAEVPQLLLEPSSGFEGREELQMAKTGERIHQTLHLMSQRQWVPKVNAFLDLGAQSENWNWNDNSRYYLLGISLDVPLFNGFRNNYQTRMAHLGLKESNLKWEESSKQLQLSAEVSKNNLGTAWHNYQALGQRLQSAKSYFRLIEKGYSEGSNSLIEFIDARNQLTTAQIQQTIQTYRVLSAMAQYERETTAYPINH